MPQKVTPLHLYRVFSVFAFARAAATKEATEKIGQLPEVNGTIFYYFGYGSNLLAKRIHIQNPTAVNYGPGLLKDYRLDFNTYGSRWDGAPATIVPHANEEVYGRLWEIELSNLPDIDNQEGVHLGLYEPISVPIIDAKNQTIMARAYMLRKQPEMPLKSIKPEELPFERQPSLTYLRCLVKGAIETGLPESYTNWLAAIKHNGRSVEHFEQLLELQNVNLPN